MSDSSFGDCNCPQRPGGSDPVADGASQTQTFVTKVLYHRPVFPVGTSYAQEKRFCQIVRIVQLTIARQALLVELGRPDIVSSRIGDVAKLEQTESDFHAIIVPADDLERL